MPFAAKSRHPQLRGPVSPTPPLSNDWDYVGVPYDPSSQNPRIGVLHFSLVRASALNQTYTESCRGDEREHRGLRYLFRNPTIDLSGREVQEDD